MGWLERLLGKKSDGPAAEAEVDDSAPGWEAIDAALAAVYPGQEPKHLANGGVRWMHDLSGRANPLDGVHIFDAGTFWHYVGLGLTELYGKDSKDLEHSGLGYELTFRLAKAPGEELPPVWPVELMNGLGRPAMLGELALGVGHTVKTGPLAKAGQGAELVGVLIHDDAALGPIETPHGKVRFLQLVPVDADHLARAQDGNAPAVLADLAREDPDLVCRAGAAP